MSAVRAGLAVALLGAIACADEASAPLGSLGAGTAGAGGSRAIDPTGPTAGGGAGSITAGGAPPAGSGGSAATGAGGTLGAGADGAGAPDALCDGSDDLRLAFGDVYGDDSASLPLEWFAGIDTPGFFVDGGCRYWSSDAGSSDGPSAPPVDPPVTYKTGVLTVDQAADLAAIVDYADLRQGVAAPSPAGSRAWTPQGGFVNGAVWADQPLATFFAAAAGSPAAGPLRIAVEPDAAEHAGGGNVAQPWPLATPITAYVVPGFDDTNVEGTLVTDPDDVAKLRALYATWRSQPDTGYLVPIEGPEKYALAMHDVLPFAPDQSATWFPGAP